MKRLVLLIAVLACSPALAQQPLDNAGDQAFAELMPTPTPEMWFYQQEARRYDSPKEMVRRNAEYRAAQRRTRIATMKWLGYSKSRPQVATTPWTSHYAPIWLDHYWYPYHFSYAVLPLGSSLAN